MPEQPPVFYKNPVIAAVLSFFITGAGHFYNCQFLRGAGFLALYGVAWLVLLFAVGYGIRFESPWFLMAFVALPAMWVWGIIDANRSARMVNAKLAAQRNEKASGSET